MSFVGFLIGVFVEIVIPVPDIIIGMLSSADISNSAISSVLTQALIKFTAYFLLPMFGAAGGFFFNSK
jgi:hypothetical protein